MEDSAELHHPPLVKLHRQVWLNDEQLEPFRVKCCTYNVWARVKAERCRWTSIPLKWSTRSQYLKQIIEADDADIVMLQEVTPMAYTDLRQWFLTRGFSGSWTGDPNPTAAGDGVAHDCGVMYVATFSRNSVWESIHLVRASESSNELHDGDGLADRSHTERHGRPGVHPPSAASTLELLRDPDLIALVEGCPAPQKPVKRMSGEDAFAAYSHDWYWHGAVRTNHALDRKGLLTVMRSTDGGHVLVLLNVHLWAGSGGPMWSFDDHGDNGVRAIQTTLYVHALARVADRVAAGLHGQHGTTATQGATGERQSTGQNGRPHVHVLFGGDLNAGLYSAAGPPDPSGVYQLLTTGRLDQSHADHPVRLHAKDKDRQGRPVSLHPASVPALSIPLIFTSATAKTGVPWPDCEIPWTALDPREDGGNFIFRSDFVFVATAAADSSGVSAPTAAAGQATGEATSEAVGRTPQATTTNAGQSSRPNHDQHARARPSVSLSSLSASSELPSAAPGQPSAEFVPGPVATPGLAWRFPPDRDGRRYYVHYDDRWAAEGGLAHTVCAARLASTASAPLSDLSASVAGLTLGRTAGGPSNRPISQAKQPTQHALAPPLYLIVPLSMLLPPSHEDLLQVVNDELAVLAQRRVQAAQAKRAARAQAHERSKLHRRHRSHSGRSSRSSSPGSHTCVGRAVPAAGSAPADLPGPGLPGLPAEEFRRSVHASSLPGRNTEPGSTTDTAGLPGRHAVHNIPHTLIIADAEASGLDSAAELSSVDSESGDGPAWPARGVSPNLPHWTGTWPPAPNRAMPSDHIPVIVDLGLL